MPREDEDRPAMTLRPVYQPFMGGPRENNGQHIRDRLAGLPNKLAYAVAAFGEAQVPLDRVGRKNPMRGRFNDLRKAKLQAESFRDCARVPCHFEAIHVFVQTSKNLRRLAGKAGAFVSNRRPQHRAGT